MVGIISAAGGYEYRRWRERGEKIKSEREKAKKQIEAELNALILDWGTFKETQEMQVAASLTNFKIRLGSTARVLQKIIASNETSLPKNMKVMLVEISTSLTKLSVKEFYLDGGVTWKEFIETGDKIIDKCKQIVGS